MTKQNNVFLFLFFVFTILFAFGHQAFGLTTNYEYDGQYRLTKVSRSDGTIIQYQYDESGNRKRMLVNMSATTQYQLLVNKDGTGLGTVTSSPEGINCGDTCSALFNEGQVVILTATATSSSVFTGWSGGGCSGTGTCSVTMDAAKNITAQFILNKGTITVIPLPKSLNAPWTLTGPNSFSVSFNGDAVNGTLDPGEYMLTWGNVAGWDKPSPQTQTLATGDSITFTGTYQLTPTIPSPPTEGAIGSDITINGSNFGATPGGGYVDFNGVHGTIISWSNTQIVVQVPARAKSGCLRVVTDYGTSSCMDFTVENAILLYGAFTKAGIWKWDGSSWSQVTPNNPDLMVATGTTLYGAFAGGGIWKWDGTNWTQATPNNPQLMVTTDTTLYGTFAEVGIWNWDGTTWTQVTPNNPQSMVTLGSDLYGAFPGGGIWKYDGTEWTQITHNNPDLMVATSATLYGSFAGGGIWKWDGSNWTQATPYNPQLMVASGENLYGSFAGGGIWKWDGTNWTQVTPNNPQTMVASDSLLYGDFTGGGIWKWDGTTWTQVTPNDPVSMAVGY